MTCVLTLILARGLQDQAFRDEFSTVDDLITKTRISNTNYRLSMWKRDKKEAPVFSLSYDTYRAHFQKNVAAAGYQTFFRLYALRVGAGNTLDGMSISPTLIYIY